MKPVTVAAVLVTTLVAITAACGTNVLVDSSSGSGSGGTPMSSPSGSGGSTASSASTAATSSSSAPAISSSSSTSGGDGGPDACVPKTCVEQGSSCGMASDGCGGELDCGTCTASEGPICGGSGTPGVCGGCAPCFVHGCCTSSGDCGLQDDGCGGVVDCGSCPQAFDAPNSTCGGGGQHGVCGVLPDGGVETCVPLTCAEQGYECDVHGDGCSGFLDCGTCVLPETCGGGGQLGVCGTPGVGDCLPKTCAQLGIDCGFAEDGCGNLLVCGSCPSDGECVQGACVPSCDEPGFTLCGDVCTNLQTDFDNCGACGNVCCQGAWACYDGMCGGGCPKGRAYCGGDFCAVGCNVELGTTANCLFCGDSCIAANATTTCDTTEAPPPGCEIVSCSPGYADCDMMEADGCEVDTTTDPENCGACGHACMAGQSCAGGACQ